MTYKVGDYGWVWDGARWASWKNLASTKAQDKPLLGYTLFIWINRVKVDEGEILQSIEVLGGKVETFLDESISFVVTDEDPTKVSNHRKDNFPLSRGQLILSRASKSEQTNGKTESISNIIDKVKDLKVKLWNVSQFLRWTQVQMSIPPQDETPRTRKRKNCQLASPLIKLEDVQQAHKPLYKIFKSDPSLYVDPLYPSSPFDDVSSQERFIQLKKNLHNQKQDSSSQSEESEDTSDHQEPVKLPEKPKVQKQQYCECCDAYFYNLQQHISPDGTHHKEFASNEENFECVKEFIDSLPAIEDFMGNVDNSNKNSDTLGCRKNLTSDMHPSSLLGVRPDHLPMLNSSYRGGPSVIRSAFDGQVTVKVEPTDDDTPPPPVHPMSNMHDASISSVPLDFSRTSQMSDICGQSFPVPPLRDYPPPPPHPHPVISHQPYMPMPPVANDKMEEQCWMPKMDVQQSNHLPLESFSFLDQPHGDTMFTSECPQTDFSFGLQNLLHSICDETEEDMHRKGTRSIDSNKENVERSTFEVPSGSAERPYALRGMSHQQQHQASCAVEGNASLDTWYQSEHAVQRSEMDSSPLELTAHATCSTSKQHRQSVDERSRASSVCDTDVSAANLAENNSNRWTVERSRRGVGLKLRFTPARKQSQSSSSLMSPPTPSTAEKVNAFDVYDWNDEDDPCSDFFKMQWKVLHTEDTKVILCRTKQFSLPRKSGKHVNNAKQLVF